MSLKDRARIRAEAREEARLDEEQEVRLRQRVSKWQRATMLLGIAWGVSIAAVVPFLAGLPLHYLWEAVGTKILLMSMVLIWPFLWTAAMTYGFRRYQRETRAIHKKFAPPGSEYRTGKSGGPARQ